MSSDRLAQLRQIKIFSGLSDEHLAGLAERCHWRSYAAGELIIGHQDRSRDVLFLISGLARVNVYALSGKQVTFRDIRPGEVFGELSAIDEKPRSASVEALAPSATVIVPQPVFHDALRSHPPVLLATLTHLTTQIRSLTDRVFEFSTLAVRSRVQAELVRLARDCRTSDNEALISPAPTHADIASRISTHREAVTRELNRLEDLKIIDREGRALRVLDLRRLTGMIDELTADWLDPG